MAVHVTRCPHCQTSFRVRDEHLNSAQGMVRCGSCLQVFKAANFLVNENTKATAATSNKAITPPTLKVVSSAAKPVPTAAPTVKSAQGKNTPPVKTFEKNNLDDIGLIHDDMDDNSISEILVDDPYIDFNLRAPEKKSRPKPRNEFEFGDIILDVENAGNLPFSPKSNKDNSDADEAWTAALLEDDKVSRPTPAPVSRPAPEKDDFKGFVDDDDGEDIPQEIMATLNLGPLNNSKKLDLGLAAITSANLYNDPLQLQQNPAKKGGVLRDSTLGWLMASLLMVGLIAAQVLYFNFDTWSRDPQWRSTYATLCGLVGCELPHIQNVNTIGTQHLRIQPHPSLKGALLVELLLVNKADYDQPFPDLLLSFRDLNNRTIASRKFTTEQYLSGEMAGQKIMPRHTPIHIALEIVDPGSEAVNYQLNLLANQH